MLGNSRHLYPGAEDEEEEEEEEVDEDEQDEEGEDEENGELGAEEEEEEMEERGGGLSRGGRDQVLRQSGKMAARSAGGDRQIRARNPGHAPNPYSSNPAPAHQAPANQQQPQQQQRRLKERGPASAPSEDAHIAMMVFRIGIPDIKQTVSTPAP